MKACVLSLKGLHLRALALCSMHVVMQYASQSSTRFKVTADSHAPSAV